MENRSLPPPTAAPNFQKDVIMPQIYDLENIKLIQSCKPPDSPRNLVKELKKAQFKKVIDSIINKPKQDSMVPEERVGKALEQDAQRRRAQSARPTQQKYAMEQIVDYEDGLFMDLDERFGEMLLLMEENYAPTREKITGVLAKVKQHVKNKELEQRKQQVRKYLSVACADKQPKQMTSKPFKDVKGHVAQLKEMARRGVKEELPRKKRAQTAAARRSTVATRQEFRERQAKSRMVCRSSSASNFNKPLQRERSKSKQLIQTINTYLHDDQRSKQVIGSKLGSMQGEWGEKSRLTKTFARSKNTLITASTLQILREKRLKSKALLRIDNEIFPQKKKQ